MKIRLQSDFIDYYDHWFAGRGEAVDAELDRMSRTEVTKEMQFWIMEMAGLRTPHHGRVRDMVRSGFALDSLYVVYTDPYAHRGEGKERMTLAEAMRARPDAHASRWIRCETVRREPMSWRVLGVGDRLYSLTYVGSEGWQSNHAREVEVTYEPGWNMARRVGFPDPDRAFPGYPLWAVDFVENEWGEYVAIDFNTAPQIRGTGIEDAVAAKQMYEDIETYMRMAAEWKRG